MGAIEARSDAQRIAAIEAELAELADVNRNLVTAMDELLTFVREQNERFTTRELGIVDADGRVVALLNADERGGQLVLFDGGDRTCRFGYQESADVLPASGKV